MMQFVTKVAQSPDTPILIVGESGTGKELVARAVHYKSPNFNGPFVTLNCATIPRELVESELFGYEKGAFSGASASGKNGLIEQAADGIIVGSAIVQQLEETPANPAEAVLHFVKPLIEAIR